MTNPNVEQTKDYEDGRREATSECIKDMNLLLDATINHVYSFFDRRINITEIKDNIKEDFNNYKAKLQAQMEKQ